MGKRVRHLLIVVCALALSLIGFGQGSAAHEVHGGLGTREGYGLPSIAGTEALTLVNLATFDLMDREGRSADQIVLQSLEATEFPDTSLGVLEPGQRYLQVATPGYVITLGTDEATYQYHGGGRRVVLVSGTGEAYSAAQRLLRTSVSDLQDRLRLPLDEVVVQSIEHTQFPDASLGVPEPGKAYARVGTPGYIIQLQAKGVVYQYYASGHRAVYVLSFVEPTRTVTVFFGNEKLAPRGTDCVKLFPVQRSLPVTPEASAVIALEQLFAGPTEAEAAQGYVSSFSEATRSILKSVKVKGDAAYVDLTDIRSLLPTANSACGQEAFFAEVETTLKEVLPVERVFYTIEGDLAAFYDWMESGSRASGEQIKF